VRFEDAQGLAAREIPHPQGIVVGTGESAAALGECCHSSDFSRVPFEDAHGLAAREIP
jgi:hypothetical protein